MNGQPLYRFNYTTASQDLRFSFSFKDTFTCRPQGPQIKPMTFRSLEQPFHPWGPTATLQPMLELKEARCKYCDCICFLQASSAAPGEHIFCTYLTQSKRTISLYGLASMQKWALLERHLFCQMEPLELNIRSKNVNFCRHERPLGWHFNNAFMMQTAD